MPALIGVAGLSGAVSARLLGGHFWHVVLLGAWLPIFALIVLFERLKARRPAEAMSPTPVRMAVIGTRFRGSSGGKHRGAVACQAMALGSVCAALIHTAVMPEHFEQSIWYGLFFLGAALGQFVFAALIVTRPRRSVVLAGTIGCGLVVVLWLVSRTLGVPIGPDNGGTEPLGSSTSSPPPPR